MAGENFDAVRVIQIILGVATIGLTAALGFLLFGRTTGLIAALAAALYGPFPFYEAQIMKTALGVFLGVAGCYALARARSSPAALLAGVILGLSVLVRENMLLLLGAGVLILIAGLRPTEGSIRRGAWLLAGGILAIGPVTIRNAIVSDDLILVTSQGGQNFYIGNNESAIGLYTQLPFVRPDPKFEQIDFLKEAKRRSGIEHSPAALSRFWFGQGFRWMGENRADAARLWGSKFLLFWNDREMPDNENFYYLRDRFPALRLFPVTFGWIAPFALIGLVISMGRFRKRAPVYMAVLANLAALVVFFLFSRYRVGAAPFLILFAAEAVRWGVLQLRERRWGKVAGYSTALAFLIPATSSFNPIDFDPRTEGMLPLHVNRALFFQEDGARTEAIQEYREVLAIDPDHWMALRQLATLYREVGEVEEAQAHMKRAVELSPHDAEVRNDLALLHLMQGDLSSALRYLHAAIRIDPYDERPRRNLARVYRDLERFDDAAREEAIADKLQNSRERRGR